MKRVQYELVRAQQEVADIENKIAGLVRKGAEEQLDFQNKVHGMELELKAKHEALREEIRDLEIQLVHERAFVEWKKTESEQGFET